MVYADAGDLAISALDTVDSGLVDRLIERASSKIDGELAFAGLTADELSTELLKECCCEMVESVLESAVGSDYGDTISYEVASRRMQVPPEYKRMLGISRQRIGGLKLQMLDIRCDVDLDGLLGKFQGDELEAAVSDVCESDILPDCNKVIPKRSGALVSSGHVNGGEITWSAVHASRVFHTNRNGGNKWDSRAWHRNKRKWGQALARRITQDD